MSKRKAELNLVIGANGTGKTSFLQKEVLPKYQKALIITPDPAEWKQYPIVSIDELKYFNAIGRMVYSGPQMLQNVSKRFYGGALLLDDAMAYLDEQTPDSLQYIYTSAPIRN